jgi:hypothetical protein
MRATTAAARRLRESNPFADDAFAGAASESLGQVTYNHIISTPAQPAAPTAAGSATVPRRRRRAGLLAGGLGLTAAGVAAVIVVALAGPAVPGGPAGHHGTAGQSAAQRLLLAAASAAAARPESSGTYWYVRQTYSSPGSRRTEETWTTHNGRTDWMWAPGLITPDRIVKLSGLQPGWSLIFGMGTVIPFPPELSIFSPAWPEPRTDLFKHVRGEHPASGRDDSVSFGQLQDMPTSPAALIARLTALARRPAILTGPAAVFESLINLITELPAPPLVRAAAFRALATLPIVIKAVTVDGHPGLRMSTSRYSWLRSATLVVNPVTSQVQVAVNAEGRSTSITAGWVNQIPRYGSP